MHQPQLMERETTYYFFTPDALLLRAFIVFVMSGAMGYLLIYKLKQMFRDQPLFINLLAKTSILLSGSFVMNFLLHYTYSVFILHMSYYGGLQKFFGDASSIVWLLKHSVGWVLLFIITQMAIEFYEKYSPGVFWDILTGKYIRPKVQKRIVMFMDLNNSTPIAEKLDSREYFSFIRDFIYYVSIALLEYDGRIYQYVGDEIVVSWRYNEVNVEKCLDALVLSTKLLARNGDYFRKKYGFTPEFKAGIHAGEVTVGEIGIIKKDLAMSGDVMNTAARIRNACTELKYSYIMSKDFLELHRMERAMESLGAVDLKGKSDAMELFALVV
jgi:adenylate cyclase